MQLSRVGNGLTPFITNVTVFNATTINEGAMLVSGASTTAQGATITIATTTLDGFNFIGVTQVGSSQASLSVENRALNSHAFGIPSSGIPNTGTTTTALRNYLPLCVNENASYFAYYSTTTGAGTASNNVATWTAGTTTAAQRGTTGVDVLGGWLFSLAGTNSASGTPTFSGSLRYISNQSATTHVTLITAMNVSTDSHMIWADRPWKKGGTLTTTADFLRSQSGSTGTGFQLNGSQILKLDNYVVSDTFPMQPLRSHVHNGLDGLTNVRIAGEIRFTAPFVIATENSASA